MIIKPSTALSSQYDEFSRLAHETKEPIFITKDGEGDLVLMSIEAYEERERKSRYVDRTHAASENVENTKEKKIMSEFLLGNVLKKMYASAPRGEQVTNIHVFAIYFADEIVNGRLNKKEILRTAELPESYQTEISKGINLADYVSVKDEQTQRIKRILSSCN